MSAALLATSHDLAQIHPCAAGLLFTGSLFVAFYFVSFVEGQRDDWDTDEIAARITRCVRHGRWASTILLIAGILCLVLSWNSLSNRGRWFSVLLGGTAAYGILCHLWTIRQKNLISRGCAWMFGASILLGIPFYFYARAPHFSGSSPTSIDIEMRSPNWPPVEPQVLVQARINGGPACARLFALLQSARLRMDHKCANIGSFTIRYDNGKADVLAFLPGHDPSGYEFRFGNWLYRMPRDSFYQVLRDAGVDTTKMPESEH